MNPNHNESMQLPPPIMEQGQDMPGDSGAEKAPGGETAPQPAQALSTQLPSIPVPMPQQATPVSQDNNVVPATSTAGLPIKDDGDLIEKEWVNKAKQIVESNRDDPYKQSE